MLNVSMLHFLDRKLLEHYRSIEPPWVGCTDQRQDKPFSPFKEICIHEKSFRNLVKSNRNQIVSIGK